MSLVPATLQSSLVSIFSAMGNMSEGGDSYLAREMALAVKTFILTGAIATVDSGAASAGSYVGAGVGIMSIDNSALESALFDIFKEGYEDSDLADEIAFAIDDACTSDNVISIVSTGVLTTPAGVSSPLVANCGGSFTSSKSVISSLLVSCFSVMGSMPEGGDAYLALQLSLAIHAYMLAGIIDNAMDAPVFVSGSGVGKIV